MGLAIEIGVLAQAKVDDPEYAAYLAEDFEAINALLTKRKLPTHSEPTDCEGWYEEAYGTAGLFALREAAALIWQEGAIPRHLLIDGRETPAADALMAAFLEHVEGQGDFTLLGQFLRGVFKAKAPVELPPYIHLIVHGDTDGLYVPVDFELPLVPKRANPDTEHLWPLGSVLRLEKELLDIARHLDIPANMVIDQATLGQCHDTPNRADDAPLWQAQPIAAFHCILLYDACQKSLETGAAIHFV